MIDDPFKLQLELAVIGKSLICCWETNENDRSTTANEVTSASDVRKLSGWVSTPPDWLAASRRGKRTICSTTVLCRDLLQ
jgi:hypothetical protein